TLGVEGATPVDVPALPDSPEGRDPPITGIGRHRVQMREQYQWTGATLPGESRVEVAPPGGRFHHLGLDSFRAELPCEEVGRGGLAARRVRGVDADQVTQQRCGFFAERVPVEVGTRGLHPEHESDGQKGGRRRQLPHRSSISTYPWLAGARTTRLF